MRFITPKNCRALSRGSVFFGTGGGSTFIEHMDAFERCFQITKRIRLQQITEFAPHTYLASLYMVGDPSQIIKNIPELIQQTIQTYQKLTNFQIGGIIPGELGCLESALETAAMMHLPLVDSDLVGGRAAPEITLDTFNIHEIPITPILVFASDGSSILIKKETVTTKIDRLVRTFLNQHGGLGILAGYGIQAQEYAKIGLVGTVSQALRVGNYLINNNLSSVYKVTDGQHIFSGKIKKVDLHSSCGFLQGKIIIDTAELQVKNEFMSVAINKKIIAKVPDLIILLDSNNYAIHNAEIKKFLHKSVRILVIPALGYWKSSIGKQFFLRAAKN